MKNPLMPIFGMLLIFFVVVFGIQYSIMAMGSSDDGVNMTNSQYESQYEAAQNSSRVGIALVQDAPMFIALLIVIVAVYGLMRYKM